jgi:hypothetical protein
MDEQGNTDTSNVFTFCSGTGNDALLFYQYIITTAYLANRKMLPFETTVFLSVTIAYMIFNEYNEILQTGIKNCLNKSFLWSN